MRRLLPALLFFSLALAQVYWPTPAGLIVGDEVGGVARFLGIPYAHAGRWQRPTLASWPQRLEAQTPGPACPQRGSAEIRLGAYLPLQKEDCLNLNVWMPLFPPPPGGFPVMVFIHGGSFTGGGGAVPIYDGRALARRGVVVVTINYRLGPFGFLALPGLAAEDPDRSTGNYGLLDQIAALRWVRENIGVFRGNPKQVTVFGESAGAMSVCALLTSPLAKGLFQRAILESGGCDQARSLEEGYRVAEAIGKRLGCGLEDTACWRRLPAEALLSLLDDADPLADFQKAPFKPHIDGYVLDLDPEAALRRGRAREISLIAGANADEYKLDFALLGLGPRSWPAFEAMVKTRTKEDPGAVRQSYQRRFDDPLEAFYAFETERVLLCPTYRAARLHQGPTYAYLFTYRSETLGFAGAFHGLELPFVFGTYRVWPFAIAFLSASDLERAQVLGEVMADLWTRFAKGEPLRAGYLPWPDYRQGWVLRFGDRVGWTEDPYRSRCERFR